MKRRDRLFILSIILFAFIITGLTILTKSQLKRFNEAYYYEEKQEIVLLAKQVSWVLKPLLQNKSYKELREFCTLFEKSDTRIFVIKDGKVLADSAPDKPRNIPEELNEDKTFILSQTVYHLTPLDIKGDNYVLGIATATSDINRIVTKSKKYIVITIITGSVIVLLFSLGTLSLYRAFNRLQNSAVQIAEGNLDTDIFVPKNGILQELAAAIDKMSKQLKIQIIEMRKLENFRSEFIASVSHVEILEEETYSENPTVAKCLSILNKQSQRLNSLVQDILSLSEIERRKISESKDFKRFNLANVIRNSISMCPATDIMFNLYLEDAEILGDSSLIEQAVINLIMNAIKYSKTEVIDITLTRTKDKTAKIVVKDYGIGIPQEHLSRIFEHFYRVDKARSRDMGGTGLGLAIVKNVVKLHNGEISVKSENGAEFTIILPLLT